MQDNYFDILSAADRLEEFIGNDAENKPSSNDYLVCPKCGSKLVTDKEKNLKYYCYKCNKDYYREDLKEERKSK